MNICKRQANFLLSDISTTVLDRENDCRWRFEENERRNLNGDERLIGIETFLSPHLLPHHKELTYGREFVR